MKSVGNLTDFVRQHMLEACDVKTRVNALIGHFDDLNGAHAAILKAKEQIRRLAPLVANCDRHAGLTEEVQAWRVCRDSLEPYFSSLKAELLEKRLDKLEEEGQRLDGRVRKLTEALKEVREDEIQIRIAIGKNGGERIEQISDEIKSKEDEKKKRKDQSVQYDDLARMLELPAARNNDTFLSNRRRLTEMQRVLEDRKAAVQNLLTEAGVELRQLEQKRETIEAELVSLRQRRSNIPQAQIAVRTALCADLGLPEEDMPFAGELLQINAAEAPWEGAIERLLHNFGLSLLVPDRNYADVAAWVNRTQLKDRRLVYFRVRDGASVVPSSLHPASLVRKISIKPDSSFYAWLEGELARRFDYACCDTLGEFRREKRALTRTGQVKGGERHEKDDRRRLDDRSRYVLGWTNEGKIAALERQSKTFEDQIQTLAKRINAAKTEQNDLDRHLESLAKIGMYSDFADLDWKSPTVTIARLRDEKRALEAASDLLQTLTSQLLELGNTLEQIEAEKGKADKRLAVNGEKREQAGKALQACLETVAAFDPEADQGGLGPKTVAPLEVSGSGMPTVHGFRQEDDVQQLAQQSSVVLNEFGVDAGHVQGAQVDAGPGMPGYPLQDVQKSRPKLHRLQDVVGIFHYPGTKIRESVHDGRGKLSETSRLAPFSDKGEAVLLRFDNGRHGDTVSAQLPVPELAPF